MEKDYIVAVSGASVVQNQNIILDELSFKIKHNEFVYLIGKTGSGKSSLLKTLYADLAAGKGKIEVAGFSVNPPDVKNIPYLRRKLGIIFQDFELFTDRSVEQNLLFVMRATGWKEKTKMKERISQVLENVGLDGIQKKMPHQLSGGEQQRVAIARALVNYPLLILADEPTGNLDPIVANDILQLFIKINEAGTAVIMATHHHSFIKEHPARVLYCDNGKIRDVAKDMVFKKFINDY